MSPELNFQLSNEDVDILHPFIQIDLRGLVAYTEFVSIAQQLITSVYQGQPDVQVKNTCIYIYIYMYWYRVCIL